MPDNDFNNGGADGLLSTDANFSLGHTPTGAETLVLDSVVSNANLNFDERLPVAGSIDGVRFDNAYAGIVDAATFGVDLGAVGLDCTGGAAATLDLGSGTWTITGGPFDFGDIGTLDDGTSTVVMVGVGTLTNLAGGTLYNLTISAGATTSVPSFNGGLLIDNNLSVSGTFALGAANSTCRINDGATADIEATGEISGFSLILRQTATISTYDGVLSVAMLDIDCRQGAIAAGLPSGDYSSTGTVLCSTTFRAGTVRLQAGVYTFNNFELASGASVLAATAVTLDLATNNPDVTIEGDWTIDVDGPGNGVILPSSIAVKLNGDLIDGVTGGSFTAGGQDITATGGGSRNWDGSGGIWGATIVNMTAGTLTFSGTWTCSSFTGTDGDLDLNGQTLTASGAVVFASGFTLADPVGSTVNCDTISFDGQDFSGASGAWNINATTSGIATGTTFEDCQFVGPGGDELDATDGTNVDGGGNNGIDFGGSSSSSSSSLTSSSSSSFSSSSSSSSSSVTSSSSSSSFSSTSSIVENIDFPFDSLISGRSFSKVVSKAV